MSDEARSIISDKLKRNEKVQTRLREFHNSCIGKRRSIEIRQKLSRAFTGRVVSLEWRKKLSVANKGRKLTEEQKQKLQVSRKNSAKLRAHCLQMSADRKGTKVTVDVHGKYHYNKVAASE